MKTETCEVVIAETNQPGVYQIGWGGELRDDIKVMPALGGGWVVYREVFDASGDSRWEQTLRRNGTAEDYEEILKLAVRRVFDEILDDAEELARWERVYPGRAQQIEAMWSYQPEN